MWSVRIPFDSTGTSNNGRLWAEQYANWKFEAEEHENGSPRLRQMPGSSSGQTPRFSNHTRRVCWQKLNGRAKRLLHLK